MWQNVYNRKSHFQFDVTSKSDLSNHRAPSLKWLAKCDVHKLTLQINIGKKRDDTKRARMNLRIKKNTFAVLAKFNQKNFYIRDAWYRIMDAIHIFAVRPHSTIVNTFLVCDI